MTTTSVPIKRLPTRLSALDPVRALAAWLIAVIVLLAGLYVASTRVDGLNAFNLDGEYNVPAFFSGGLLLAAAATAWRFRTAIAGVRVWGGILALLFAVMSMDEIFGAHEALEGATGVDWMVLYSPVALAGGVAWLGALRALWGAGQRHVAGLWAAGAAAWVIAQALEALQWHGDVKAAGYYKMMPPEEILEMTGSAAFLVALLSIVRSARGARSARSARGAR